MWGILHTYVFIGTLIIMRIRPYLKCFYYLNVVAVELLVKDFVLDSTATAYAYFCPQALMWALLWSDVDGEPYW